MSTLRALNDELFTFISNDIRDASPRFTAMKKAYLQLADVDLDNPTMLEENASKLSRLLDFVQMYLNNHGGLHGTQKGRDRFAWAKQLKNLVKPLSEAKNQQLYEKVNREKAAYGNTLPGDLKNLKKLGKLQRSIGTADFVPRTNDFQLKPTLWQRFKAVVGRGIGHLMNGIFTMTTGLVSLIAVAPFTTTRKYENIANQQNSDMKLVPGSQTGEQFEELHPEAGPENQEICGDTRRVPINYEAEIPEDPNQPPTITLCFEQGTEGKTIAMGGDKGQGHAFISLKYTRNNPITGQPERYKCSFGFYPNMEVDSNAVFAAMGSTGLVMPGIVQNDGDHSYSTSKTFTVNNKIINTIFKHAGDYAKEGYSYLTRSCATFARDMAVIAELPADEYFAETDFEGTQANVTKTVSFVGVGTIGRLGEYALLKNAEKRNTSYERFGQRVINKEDVDRLNKQEINPRLKGYVPSVSTEAARNEWDFHLGSKRYVPNIEEEEGQGLTSWKKNLARMLKEQQNLLDSAEKFLIKNRVPEEQIRTLTENLNSFMATNDKIIETYGKKAYAEEYAWPQGAEPTYKQSIAATRNGTKAISQYIDGLDHIFRTTFKSDPRLNICFQHMASTLQHMSEDFAINFRDLKKQELLKDPRTDLYQQADICDIINPQRDDFLPMAKLQCTYSAFSSNALNYAVQDSFSPTEIAGLIKSFGSLEEYIRRVKERETVKEEHGEASKEYKLLDEKLYWDKNTARSFSHACETLNSKTKFTRHDVDFAFRQLPQGIGKAILSNPDADPSTIYQSKILASYLPGLRNICETGMLVTKRDYLKKSAALESMKEMMSLKEYAARVNALNLSTRDQLARTALSFVAQKLADCDLLNPMLEGLKEAQYKEVGIDPATATPDQKAQTEKAVLSTFTELLCAELISPMMEDISHKMDNSVHGDPQQETEFSKIVTCSINAEKMERSSGATDLMCLMRDRLAPGSVCTEEQRKVLVKKELIESARVTFENIRRGRAKSDVAQITNLEKELGKKLDAVGAKGQATADNPQAIELLSRVMACGILRSCIRSEGMGLTDHASEKLIVKETAKMQEYGVFAFLKNPEYKETIKKALDGDIIARNSLVKQGIKDANKISTEKRKAANIKLRAHEIKNDDKALTKEVNEQKSKLSSSLLK